MKKKNRLNLKDQIASSLEQEETATKDRFAKADGVFAKTEPAKAKTPKPKAPPKKKEKVVRQIFSMPKTDLQLIEELQKKCMKNGFAPNQSEVVRGGLHALNNLKPKELATVLQTVEKMKIGRPA